MVGNRPVVGVRNPVRSTSISSFLRAKNAGTGSPESDNATDPAKRHPKSEPCPKLLEAAPEILNEKKY
jgi:hypothetical protein